MQLSQPQVNCASIYIVANHGLLKHTSTHQRGYGIRTFFVI
ncbi:hypothetical protein Loa_02340 [Legionella oakridgensis ATCC 33761 = DSM 21215]|uniref:Uncharacterized protein n=1 Tax=Legionella oakridgensis ATCC 33761 = DSM 21215 TaxID=1268635 RepID=W0BGY9_9GAMM|nr:hypothetical protein Loa_02340 [Legionella oakridgensis ATCC 33761 = DSM 21215]ETO92515.1 hypothetical protein LOR_63c16010 [Legionella oakridgensis RV-2-2007]STY20888.1 Uncharacterised protein [Legionella longbeachae]